MSHDSGDPKVCLGMRTVVEPRGRTIYEEKSIAEQELPTAALRGDHDTNHTNQDPVDQQLGVVGPPQESSEGGQLEGQECTERVTRCSKSKKDRRVRQAPVGWRWISTGHISVFGVF